MQREMQLDKIYWIGKDGVIYDTKEAAKASYEH